MTGEPGAAVLGRRRWCQIPGAEPSNGGVPEAIGFPHRGSARSGCPASGPRGSPSPAGRARSCARRGRTLWRYVAAGVRRTRELWAPIGAHRIRHRASRFPRPPVGCHSRPDDPAGTPNEQYRHQDLPRVHFTTSLRLRLAGTDTRRPHRSARGTRRQLPACDSEEWSGQTRRGAREGTAAEGGGVGQDA